MKITIETNDAETVRRITTFSNALGVDCDIDMGDRTGQRVWNFYSFDIINSLGHAASLEDQRRMNELIQTHDVIGLIKQVRASFRLGLAEAKDIVDKLTGYR